MEKQYKKYKIHDGVTLQVISYTDEMMVAKLWFVGKDARGTHHHINQEIDTVLSGKFEAVNGDEKVILTTGESVHIYNDNPHSLECLTPTGEIIACWSPARKDIIEKYTEEE
ncbi:cupin domain-containing protein [Chryseobacterium indoltheticum]|jgi:quercetin dioxygenase-like cupin family protein|uniref:cupin domain-containing protein n=1 Tax=Chryseobacterium indoltheticum TaxID=254 RepID=UPI00243273BF|nr:cupin domain-containing protein [Chryseobacterium indoltheticum]MDF2831461.1 cupin protein [Chryseobacterium indoltheticum]